MKASSTKVETLQRHGGRKYVSIDDLVAWLLLNYGDKNLTGREIAEALRALLDGDET